MNSKDLATILKVLANERRIRIIRLLLRSSEQLSTSTIAIMSRIPEPQTSAYLNELFSVGLVVRTQSGRWVFYGPNRETMKGLIRFWRSKPKTIGELSDETE